MSATETARAIAAQWRNERDNPHASQVQPEKTGKAREANRKFAELRRRLRKCPAC